MASIADWKAWWEGRNPNAGLRRAIDRSVRVSRMTTFVQCLDCDLYQVATMPEAAELSSFYENYAFYDGKSEAKMRHVTRRLRRLGRPAGGTFLDVGANFGFSTEAARRFGYVAHGIDIDADAIAAARQDFPEAQFSRATAEDFAASGFQADLVYCSEVIEHLSEPKGFAAALARLTKPGGRLFLTTPDAGHWRRPSPFIAWNEVKPPEHLIWFSKRNLTKLLTAAGFSRLRFAMTFKPGIRLIARR